MTGVEWVIDARGCDAARLDRPVDARRAVRRHRRRALVARRWRRRCGMSSREPAGSPACACSPSRISPSTHSPSTARSVSTCSAAVLAVSGTPRRGCSDTSARARWTCGASNAATERSPLFFRERANGGLSELRRCNRVSLVGRRADELPGMRLGARAPRSRSREGRHGRRRARRRCRASSSAPRAGSTTTGSSSSAASSTSTSAATGASGTFACATARARGSATRRASTP